MLLEIVHEECDNTEPDDEGNARGRTDFVPGERDGGNRCLARDLVFDGAVGLVNAAREDGGNGKKECESCGSSAVEAERSRHRDGRTGTRNAGYERQGLRDANRHALGQFHVGEDSIGTTDLVGNPQDDAENHENRANQPERTERLANRVLKYKSEDRNRNGSTNDEPAEARLNALFGGQETTGATTTREHGQEPRANDVRDVLAEIQQDGEFGADLRNRSERRARVFRAGQEKPRDAQMGTRRNRKELGEPLNEPEDQRGKDVDVVQGCHTPIVLVVEQKVGEDAVTEIERVERNPLVHAVKQRREVEVGGQAEWRKTVAGDTEQRESLVVRSA